jgi:hypothetical protein
MSGWVRHIPTFSHGQKQIIFTSGHGFVNRRNPIGPIIRKPDLGKPENTVAS